MANCWEKLVIVLVSFEIIWVSSLCSFGTFMTDMIYLFFCSRNGKNYINLLFLFVIVADKEFMYYAHRWMKKNVIASLFTVWQCLISFFKSSDHNLAIQCMNNGYDAWTIIKDVEEVQWLYFLIGIDISFLFLFLWLCVMWHIHQFFSSIVC